MGLKQVLIPTYVVKAPGSDFAVRALTFAEISTIAKDFAPEAAMAFGKIVSRAKLRSAGSQQVTAEEVKDIIRGLLPAAPKLVGAVIALASDEYEPACVEIASKLPVGIQVEAIEQIFQMTFSSDAELKKLVESITRMLGSITASVQQMRLPLSELGIGASDAA